MILGPELVARDLDAHGDIVNKATAAMESLWAYRDEVLARERAEVVEPE